MALFQKDDGKTDLSTFMLLAQRIYKKTIPRNLILLAASLVIPLAFPPLSTAQTSTNEDNALPSDVLSFQDGGMLHGQLQSIDTKEGIQWQHPLAKNVIKFSPKNIASIKFENAKSISSGTQQRCWLQFSNGDELFGNLNAIDREKMNLETWFGGNLEAPRETLRAVTFFSHGYTILYEGPSGQDGWRLDQGPRGWQYKDGAFIASSAGILGRDLGLKESSSVQFDLAWNGHFSMSFILYTENFDRFDYSTSSYMFHLAPGYINLQRIQTGAGVTSLGQVQIPNMTQKNKVRLEIRSNKEDATIAVIADGVLVHRWKDHAGFAGKGPCAVFSSQTEGPVVQISNIKVAQWDGTFEPPGDPVEPLKEDSAYLINHDKFSGNLQAIRNGKAVFEISKSALSIPLDRITQIVMQESKTNAAVTGPWDLRAEVAGGGSIGFRLENWGRDKVTGTSPNFGKLAVDPKSIRQIQFNPAPTKTFSALGKPSEDPNLKIDE